MGNAWSDKRLGFILASIHAGSGEKLWTGLARHVRRESGAFFIFPGGKLSPHAGTEKLRNSIYALANDKTLDGLISWSSSLGGAVSVEALNAFHARFSIPYVTIGQKIDQHPLVEFDAYAGMKELTEHFIHHHGARRIVFLRAPENHKSANDRYQAFVDALTEAGLYTEENKKLITDPFDWNDGLGAMRQICDDRGLRPKLDFDAVIAASDLMAFAAVNWLGLIGCQIPDDIIVGGFNDSPESQVSPVPFSTVHMPYEEIGSEAHRMLGHVLKKEKKIDDKLLSAYPIIRESCGCNSIAELVSDDAEARIETPEQCMAAAKALFKKSLIPEKRVERLVNALFAPDAMQDFLSLANETLTRYFERGGELSKIFQALKLVRRTMCIPEVQRESILRTMSVLIPRLQAQIFTLTQYGSGHAASSINTLKTELLAVHDRSMLISVLEKYLPLIGIQEAALVLYKNNGQSQYIGGFDPTGEVTNEVIAFPADQLLPERFDQAFANGVYLVQPLFDETHAFGYVILGYGDCDGAAYEDLRHAIGDAVRSVSLFEELSQARQAAEQAERDKTEFFASVGSDLCDPLKDLSAKITQMESNIENGILDADILSEQLLFLKSQIASQLEKTLTLVELTRMQLDEMPLDKKLFDLASILPESVAQATDPLPLLYGDVERLGKALHILFEHTVKDIVVHAALDGVHILLTDAQFTWQKPEFLLAEKVILLHYGDIKKAESTEIVLPLPNLIGAISAKQEMMPTKVISLSREYPKTVLDVVPEKIVEGFADTCTEPYVLFWNPDRASTDEWIKVYSLRHHDLLSKTPLVCYSRSLIGKNFLDALLQTVSSKKSSTVLFISAKHTRYGSWATDENSVSISSMTDFARIINEVVPSLIVFEAIDEEGIKVIRKHPKTMLTPILILPDIVDDEEKVELLCSQTRIILCNRGAAESDLFDKRIQKILQGDEILPPHTGALVKKAILYLNKNAGQQVVRWKLADTVHVSEDYLTRIFHKEIGLSLWEYLNRYRIYIATKMLLETNDTIYEISENAGFQDQAYFCRVFKKIYGMSPGRVRTTRQ